MGPYSAISDYFAMLMKTNFIMIIILRIFRDSFDKHLKDESHY